MGGKILETFNALGGVGFFGNAVNPESPAANYGRWQEFSKPGTPWNANSSIYWNANVANGRANQVGGLIREKWGQLGWEGQFMGYPTTNESQATGGRFNHFQGGSIYWSGTTGAHQIGGQIFNKWGTLDYERSRLGFPTSDEFSAGSGAGRGNHFAGGEIYWSQPTGAHPVWGKIRDEWIAAGWENGQYGFPVSDEYDYKGGHRQDFQRGSIEVDTVHGSVTHGWYGYKIYMDSYLVDKITSGAIPLSGGLVALAAALGLAGQPAGAIVAAVAAIATSAISLCKAEDGSATFYIAQLAAVPIFACNPFARMNGMEVGEGEELVTNTEPKPEWQQQIPVDLEGSTTSPTTTQENPSASPEPGVPTQTPGTSAESSPPTTPAAAPEGGAQHGAPATETSTPAAPLTTTAVPPTTTAVRPTTTTARPTTTTQPR
ncbi:LGFP repeat-containing protein [Prescottella agglutinans]|uniref:LGFP repeat-containing protein n=1 Tax=Prescottella agglutinans TaxID=1644129 RepID=UPI002476EAFE|nr:hypothetical protein [Prescottella agglutinans]